MKKDIETGIILQGDAKLGNMLLEEAANLNRDKVQKRVVGVIAQLLEQVEIQKQSTKVLEDTVNALKTGAFTLNKDGVITYNDPVLNNHTRSIVPCAQCGYNKIVLGNLR